MSQLHKHFNDAQLRELFARYLNDECPRRHLQEVLGIRKRRFFGLLKRYRANPKTFSIQYQRRKPSRAIPKQTELHSLKELATSKQLIENKAVPIRSYNYSYIQDTLEHDHGQKVSLSTIIHRAKHNGSYLKRSKRSVHDRAVLTQYAGQLIQHDSSFHLWAPAAGEKWHLITSIDDYSRFILYAELIRRESTWAHIQALQTVFRTYGLPLRYYVDSHSIFRFVQGRDSAWRDHRKLTDEVDPQWKRVLRDCGVEITYALSPQAKGKIERPYQWLQDRLVRTCVRDNTHDIRRARALLRQEVGRYNYRRGHSTTLEVPHMRFQNALRNQQSLLRPFRLKPPFQSVKDVFSLRTQRTVNAYRRVSINGIPLAVQANPGDRLEVRCYPMARGLTELRFWREHKLIDVQTVKTRDLEGVHF